MRRLRFEVAANKVFVFDAETGEDLKIPIVAFEMTPVRIDTDVLVTLTVYADKITVVTDKITLKSEVVR